MKKLIKSTVIFPVLLILFFISGNINSIAQVNLLKNEYFEEWDNGNPIDWTWSGATSRLSKDSESPFEGNYNISLTPIGSDNILLQLIDGLPGITYKAEIWAKGTNGARVRAGIRRDGNNAYGSYTELEDNVWTRITYTRPSIYGNDDGIIISVVESTGSDRSPITIGSARLTPLYDFNIVSNPLHGGSVEDLTNNAPYSKGESIEIKATPKPGFVFNGWLSENGRFINRGDKETTFIMPAKDANVIANFEAVNLLENEYFEEWTNGSVVNWDDASNHVDAQKSEDALLGNFSIGANHSFVGERELALQVTKHIFDPKPDNGYAAVVVKGTGFIRIGIKCGQSTFNHSDWIRLENSDWTYLTHERPGSDQGNKWEFAIKTTARNPEDSDDKLNVELNFGAAWLGLNHPPEGWPFYTWTGDESTVWEYPANWYPEIVPAEKDTASIPGNLEKYPVVNNSHTISHLRINAGGNLTINSNGKLTVENKLSNFAGMQGLIIDSDASGTGSLIHFNDGTEATVRHHFPVDGQGWNFISSPVSVMNITESGFYPGNNDDFYLYDETGWWRNIKDVNFETNNNGSTIFLAGKGYLVSYDEPNNPIKEFKGVINTDNISVPLLYDDNGKFDPGWNLLGNPYPTAISIDEFDFSNLKSNFLYIYDPSKGNGGGYISYEKGSEKVLLQNQGFFVEAKEANNFEFTNNMRTHPASDKQSNEIKDLIRLRFSANGFYDETTLRIRAQSSFEKDRYDALKLFSFNEKMPQIYSYSTDRKKLAINSMSSISGEESINIGMRIPADGEYTLSVSELTGVFFSATLFLIDNITEKVINLKENPVYVFNASEGNLTGRFEIFFGREEYPVKTNESVKIAVTKIWHYNNILYVESKESSKVTIYDLNGRQIKRMSANKGMQSYPLELYPGIYIVEIINKNKTQSARIVIF